jgi:glycosyltransferase involved in cell wall biosynthesis
MPSCVIVVENLPVPFDRRVWQEARALRDDGWDVAVICPQSEKHPEKYEEQEGIAIYRHPLPLEARGPLGFLIEYSSALFWESYCLLKIAFSRGFDVIQICNPPDVLFLAAAPYKLLGKRIVFDHHDVCPELFEAKFGRRGVFHRLLLIAERLTFRIADRVISANETYRGIALSRGARKPDDVVAVYSVPERARLRRVKPNEDLRGRARIVLGYVGIIGDQDGVDHFVHCVDHLVSGQGHNDIRAVVVGDGPALASVKALADEIGIADRITFTGYLRGDDLLGAMSTFDIGIMPDPMNEYNDKISMNKVFEYSALGIPCVAYNLTETRRLLGNCGFYADSATPESLARACLPLITNETLRHERGRAIKALSDQQFDWERESDKYTAVYRRLFKDRSGGETGVRVPNPNLAQRP